MPVVTTSGLGMTRERARALRPFAQVNVSYDGAAGVYDAVRAFDGSGAAERAMGLLHEEGVAYGVNVVLTRDSFPALPDTLERARSLGAREAQLLRYKPAGRAARLDYFAKRLTRDQVRELGDVVRDLSRRFHPVGFRLRIDCSMVPLLSDALYERASDLKKLGVLGCEAGAALEAVRTDGRTAPCSFIDASVTTWGVEEPCRSCALREVCRGGCKAVARYVDGGDGPDPECPRVVRLRGSPSA
jgi:MoaA/NifB/PqqE/SkfB family radical SAM enzyme